MSLELLVVATIFIALLFDFINGFHDSANAIATVVATRVLKPFQAVLMAGAFNFIGPFVFSLAIANAVGKGIIQASAINTEMVLAALLGAIVWDLITWWVGLPTSSSHALVGGLVGAGLASVGASSIIWPTAAEGEAMLRFVAYGGLGGLALGALMIPWSRIGVPRGLLPAFVAAGLVGMALFAYSKTPDTPRLVEAVVAGEYGQDLVKPVMITLVYLVLGAILGVFMWAAAQQPMSARDALLFIVPGAAGTLAVATLLKVLHLGAFTKVLVFMVVSPVLGFFMAFVMSTSLQWMWRNTHTADVNRRSRRMQLGSSAFYALTHGTNDAQKTMGIIGVLLLSVGEIGLHPDKTLALPVWVIISSAAAMGLGTAFGGWKIVKTMAARITHLTPAQGFAAETGGGVVLVAMAESGIPVSTTHAISSSIMGVGATRRMTAVRWSVGRQMFIAWILTIPASAIVAVLTYLAIVYVIGPITPW